MAKKSEYASPVLDVELFGKEDVLTASRAVAWSGTWSSDGWAEDWVNVVGGDEE
jgi:hypothetical protein